MILNFIIEDPINLYLQKNFHRLIEEVSLIMAILLMMFFLLLLVLRSDSYQFVAIAAFIMHVIAFLANVRLYELVQDFVRTPF